MSAALCKVFQAFFSLPFVYKAKYGPEFVLTRFCSVARASASEMPALCPLPSTLTPLLSGQSPLVLGKIVLSYR